MENVPGAAQKVGADWKTSLVHWARVFFSGLGLVLSVLGIIGSIVAYMMVAGVVSDSEKIVTGQIDGVVAALGTVEASVAAAENATVNAGNATSELASAFDSYANSTAGVSTSLSSLGDAVSAVPGGLLGSSGTALKDNAAQLQAASEKFRAASVSTRSMAGDLKVESKNMAKLRSDIGTMKANMSNAKLKIREMFGTLSTVLFIIAVVMVFLFAAVASASVAALL